MTERLVDLVGKLLAQAEGTDNEHEAAAFVERAQQLATAHAVDLELARARQRDRQGRSPAAAALVQERVDIGARGRRGNRHRVLLYVAVAAVNDVRVNVARDSTWVLGFGHEPDLAVVGQLWASLAVQMASAAQRRLDAGEHRAGATPAQTWRLSFYDGWVLAVGNRLAEARERTLRQLAEAEVQEEAEAAARAGAQREPGRVSRGELVLRAKADRVGEFYAAESTARGSWRGAAAGRTQQSSAARRAGEYDGARADLGRTRMGQRGRLEA